MFKIRLNLRKVATIVACLAVIFASCGNNGGDDDDGGGNGNGKNEQKLIGRWVTGSTSSGIYYPNSRYLLINKDGTFSYYHVTSAKYSYDGKYSVSDGKIYFTNVVFSNDGYSVGFTKEEPNSSVNYKIEVGKEGEQLIIDNTGGCFMGSPTFSRAN